VYDFVAKNRYQWFGKKETCMVPTVELKSLFLDVLQ
jgi:predicted DCC family thiol-disulfide oxidoreductase YuxK